MKHEFKPTVESKTAISPPAEDVKFCCFLAGFCDKNFTVYHHLLKM